MFRVTSDILSIDRRLKEYDPQLFIMYDPQAGKFEVWREDPDGPHRVLVVEDEQGNPMPLDMRVVDRIRMADAWRRPVGEILAEIDRKNAAVERDRARKTEEAVEETADRLFHAFRKAGVIT